MINIKFGQSGYIAMIFASYLFTIPAMAQSLVINEVMSSNNLSITDEDGDTPDWVELLNTSETPINLSGFILADSSTLTSPWTFPEMQLSSGEHLLLFASDKDRRELPLHWETIIDWGDPWNYLVPDASTPENWFTPDFDDSSWGSGASGFGYGDDDDSTEVEGAGSVYIRKEFEITNSSDIAEILFHIDYDDAFVAYINGHEVARENITSEGPPPFDQFADDFDNEAQLYQMGAPSVFKIGEIDELLTDGTNLIAIQVHNANATSSDLSAIPFLSLGSTVPVDGSLSSHLTTGTNYLHTNFKLDADGELLILLNSEGELMDSVHIKALPTDVSYGRNPDGSDHWSYFEEPTPGDSNLTTGYDKFYKEVSFSQDGGLYDGTMEVALSTESDGQIYFTTDGSLPHVSGVLYDGPLSIDKTTVLRAQVLGNEGLHGPIGTRTYLMNTDHEISIISISTAPKNLWDYHEGIYVMGPNAAPEQPHEGANFWQDWEKPIYIEMYEPDGNLGFAQDAGVKIFGGWSRVLPQKSLSIFARKTYGDGDIDYKIFSNLEVDEFSSLVLRNSGNDLHNTMFRDALLTSLFHESVDKQAYRPAALYLNGEYWGIHNIREKINEDFLANHYNLDPDSITILEHNAIPVEGDEQEYVELISYISSNDLSMASNYEYVTEHIDISNYIYYQLGNIFIDNRDWPGNNIKYWKSNRPDGKWRWITYDKDFGFDLWSEGTVYGNTLEFALNPNGPEWPNPPWSTLLFRRLIENDDFKNQFINTFADELNSRLTPEHVISNIDSMESAISNDIGDHLNRWNRSLSGWKSNVNRMREFAEIRPGVVRNNIKSVFSLPSSNNITLQVNNEAHGDIQINTLTLSNYPWSGEYFASAPVTLRALPKPGYRFLRWEGDQTGTSSTLLVNVDRQLTIRAVFEESDSELNTVVINEINYNSDKDSETEDWIELYNNSPNSIDLSGWIIKDNDDDHAFVIENGTMLSSGAYIVICRDQEVFQTIHSTSNTLGNMNFGLSSDGDCVRLFNSEGIITDQVCYSTDAPWPSLPDGKGGTLALKKPTLDNADAASWYGLSGNGNPGEANEIDLDLLGTIDHPEKFSFYPNPVTDLMYVKIALNKTQNLTLVLQDLSGKRIATIYKGEAEGGSFSKEIDLPDGLKAGLYVISMVSESEVISRRIIIR